MNSSAASLRRSERIAKNAFKKTVTDFLNNLLSCREAMLTKDKVECENILPYLISHESPLIKQWETEFIRYYIYFGHGCESFFHKCKLRLSLVEKAVIASDFDLAASRIDILIKGLKNIVRVLERYKIY